MDDEDLDQWAEVWLDQPAVTPSFALAYALLWVAVGMMAAGLLYTSFSPK